MRGAPCRLRPEGGFLMSTRPGARLIETFGTDFLRRSFWLAAALLPLPRRLFTLNRISSYGAYLSAAGTLLLLYLTYDAFTKKPLAEDYPCGASAAALVWTLSSPPPFHQFETLPISIVGNIKTMRPRLS